MQPFWPAPGLGGLLIIGKGILVYPYYGSRHEGGCEDGTTSIVLNEMLTLQPKIPRSETVIPH